MDFRIRKKRYQLVPAYAFIKLIFHSKNRNNKLKRAHGQGGSNICTQEKLYENVQLIDLNIGQPVKIL